jgi:hypothetical protein
MNFLILEYFSEQFHGWETHTVFSITNQEILWKWVWRLNHKGRSLEMMIKSISINLTMLLMKPRILMQEACVFWRKMQKATTLIMLWEPLKLKKSLLIDFG